MTENIEQAELREKPTILIKGGIKITQVEPWESTTGYGYNQIDCDQAVNEIATLISHERAEAVKDFYDGMPSIQGLSAKVISKYYGEYLKTKEEV